VIAVDPAFARLVIGHARVERLHTGCRWTEGPVYVPASRHLLWSDIPNNRVLRFDECDASVSVFEHPCGHHNGHTIDREGRVIACEHLARRVSRREHDGSVRALASHWQGQRLNSPNDVVVHADGSVWFTDPTYGIDSDYEGDAASGEIGASNVYRVDADSGRVTRVVTDRVKPNGLAFSVDQRTLYVVDTGGSHVPGLPSTIHAYDVPARWPATKPARGAKRDSGGDDHVDLGRGRLFATCPDGSYDGIRVDTLGHVWAAAGREVHCLASDGRLIGRIVIGEMVGNLCFGGPKANRLYICAQTSLYALYVNVRGVTPWDAASG
jgi:gluconolactonase